MPVFTVFPSFLAWGRRPRLSFLIPELDPTNSSEHEPQTGVITETGNRIVL